MDRPELEKRLDQLGLWPTVREFLTPAFLQHFYTQLDQLIMAGLKKEEKGLTKSDLNDVDEKRSLDDNKYVSVDKSNKGNVKKAAPLPEDTTDWVHYDTANEADATADTTTGTDTGDNNNLVSPQIEGRPRRFPNDIDSKTSLRGIPTITGGLRGNGRSVPKQPSRPESFWFRFMSCGPGLSIAPSLFPVVPLGSFIHSFA
jgi:hypothetical protein